MQLEISESAARVYIAQLDLDYIVATMCADTYPLPIWTKSDALNCLSLYKNFLILRKKHLKITLVPTKQIDEFWHNHILHTKQYHFDCQQIFGFYLHHEPLNPATEDRSVLAKHYLQTKALYLAEFGHPLTLV